MPRIRRFRIRAALLAAALALCSLAPAAAAQPGNGASVIVTVPEEFPVMAPHREMRTDAHALILRFPPGRGEDVIVLRRGDTSPEVLAAAIDLLRKLREREPRVQNAQVVTLATYELASNFPGAVLDRLSVRLREIQAQPTVRVGDFGPGKWIRLPDALLRP